MFRAQTTNVAQRLNFQRTHDLTLDFTFNLVGLSYFQLFDSLDAALSCPRNASGPGGISLPGPHGTGITERDTVAPVTSQSSEVVNDLGRQQLQMVEVLHVKQLKIHARDADFRVIVN